jgi:L-lactate dehydrogenase complex protein LldG
MNPDRAAFLARVRSAVAAGNAAGQTPPLPERGQVGYQGAGANPLERFVTELQAAGGHGHIVNTFAALEEKVLEILRPIKPALVVLGTGGIFGELQLARTLSALGCKSVRLPADDPDECRTRLFSADATISEVNYFIAESGTVVVKTAPNQPRGLSLLAPVHIALAERKALLPDLFDLFVAEQPVKQKLPPSCLTFITGPSKTGDIELKLVTGVHGPGKLHVIVVDA